MLKHYEIEVTIFVTGKNRRGDSITAPFHANDFANIMIFGNQTVKGFYNSEECFRNDVRTMEDFMTKKAQEHIKQTFFKKRDYVLNYYDKIFEPEFMTHTTCAEITDPKRFKVDYLKKHLSLRQFKEVFGNA